MKKGALTDLANKDPERNIRKRTGKRKPLYQIFLIALIVMVGVGTCKIVYDSYQLYRLHQLKIDLQQEIEALKEKNELLEIEKKRLQTPDEIEKAARQQLGMVKPGEVPYVR